MELVWLAATALGVGGATVIGAVIGFIFKGISHKFSDAVLAFAAGVMLAAAILGLILPSLEHGGKFSILITALGIITGAVCMKFVDVLVPHLHKMSETGQDIEAHSRNKSIDKVMLFVIAIAIHNFPEGISAGVGFGTGDTGEAVLIALGIALQNIPEGMVIISPMLATGMSPKKTFLIAAATGMIEIVGTIVGFLAVSVASFILPFALSLAGGTMLYVISDEMIPETHAHGAESAATFSLIAGFILMLVFDFFI